MLNTQSSWYFLHPGSRRVTASSRESNLTAVLYAYRQASAEVRPKRRPIACQPALKHSLRLAALNWRNIERAYQKVERLAGPSPRKCAEAKSAGSSESVTHITSTERGIFCESHTALSVWFYY